MNDMVEKGRHGLKTGKGFFEYEPGRIPDIIKERDVRLIRLANVIYGDKKKSRNH